MPTHFDKYEGLGNDFVIVEGRDPLGAERVVRVCDRHFGVGGDGVLVVGPARSSGARASMIVENADGSRPEMCGNGLRCVALHLARRDGKERAEYVVDTDAGTRLCVVERDGDGGSVSLDMGQAHAEGNLDIDFEGTRFAFERVSIGNPHAIRYGDIPTLEVMDRLGPLLSSGVLGGTNVEFVTAVEPREFKLVVWERGVGRTLACGTGAAATAASLALAGRAPFGEPLRIHLPGGPLEVSVARESLAVSLRGPARRVFGGEFGSG